MRVTQNMMVNNLIHWTSRQTEKLYAAQETVSSGKQINKPSDDPSAAGQILSDRATISQYGQYESNIDQAATWIEIDEAILDSLDSLVQEAQEVIMTQTSDDAQNLQTAVMQLESLYEQVLVLANERCGSVYMYSGNCSDAIPFANEVSVSGAAPSDIVFDLAADAANATIEITNADGELIRTLTIAGALEGTNTVSWDGCDENGNLLPDGDYNFSVAAADSAGNAVAAYPTYRGDAGGKTVMIGNDNEVVLNNDGGDIFTETIRVLSEAIAALTTPYDADLLSELSERMDEASSHISLERTDLANALARMETADARLNQLTLALENRITDIESGSTEEAVIKLKTQETAYDAALQAASDVLKMSKLSDYI